MENNRDNIEQIKERIDIISLIEKYVKLKQAGKNFVGLCPFHNEKTPSFSVSSELQMYKCFGCGKSGDIFSFIEEVENIDFSQALEKLAKEAGIQINLNKDKKFSPLLQINQWAVLNYQKELFNKKNEQALNYLIGRGIDKELIKTFEIGYAPGDDAFLRRLNGYKNFSKQTLIDSGLFIEKESVIKEKFKKRIVFPIQSIFGNTIAFTGRLLPGNKFGPKYLHTSETPLFKKRFHIDNLFRAKSYIRKEDFCIILEGSIDVIALYKLGVKNVVATLGTSLTIQQLELISKYTKNLLFIFDSDNAGQKALERSFILSSQLNLNSYAINTGIFKDVDEMAQKEPKELLKKIEEKTDTFTYLISNKIETLDLSKLNSTVKLNAYIQGLLNEVKDENIKNFFQLKAQKIIGGEIKFEQAGKPVLTNSLNKENTNYDNAEDSLLAFVIRYNSKQLPDSYSFELFENPRNQTIAGFLQGNSNTTPQELISHFAYSMELKDWVERLLMKDTQNLEIEKLFKRIYTIYLSKKMRELRMLLAAAEETGDQKKINNLLSKVQELTDKLRDTKHENI